MSKIYMPVLKNGSGKTVVRDAKYLFANNANRIPDDYDLSQVTDIRYLFYNSNNITSTDVSQINTSNITDMTSAFFNCSNLTSLDLSTWDMTACNQYPSFLETCSKLSDLKLPDGIHVYNGTSMFKQIAVVDGSIFKDIAIGDGTVNTVLSGMFRDSVQLTSLDLSGMVNNIMTGNNMAYFCWDTPKLTKVWIPSTCVTLYATDANNAPFRGTNTSCVIYTDAPSKPSGWSDYFNYQSSSTQLTVQYGTSHAQYTTV